MDLKALRPMIRALMCSLYGSRRTLALVQG